MRKLIISVVLLSIALLCAPSAMADTDGIFYDDFRVVNMYNESGNVVCEFADCKFTEVVLCDVSSINEVLTTFNVIEAKTKIPMSGEVTVKLRSTDKNFDLGFLLKDHNHDYSEKTYYPSYENEGYTYLKCSSCDAVKFTKSTNKLKPLKIKVNKSLEEYMLTWNKAGNVSGYEIYQKVSDEGYKYYSTVTSTKEAIPITEKVCYYKVRHFIEGENGTRSYGKFSNTLKVVKEDIKLKFRVASKNVNNMSYKLKTDKKIRLTWDKVKGVSYYKIYKYNSKKGKYFLYATKKGSVCTVSGLSSLTEYKFKLQAYTKENKKVASEIIKVKTRNKTNGYFINKCVWNGTWDNILVTSKKASNSQIDDFEVYGHKQLVKYNYVLNTKTLYIHAYVKYKGAGLNTKYDYYRYGSYGYYKSKTSKYTYKDIVKAGIREKWNVSVKGSCYDFTPGCNFKTKVILHSSSKHEYQNYTHIEVGGEPVYDFYWFYAKVGHLGDMHIILPTQKQLASNYMSVYPPRTKSEYKDSVGHEFGHILGLSDAYATDVVARGKRTEETGRIIDGEFRSIMFSTGGCKANSNDIEMILQAQAESVYGRPNKQYYKTYTEDGITRVVSKVIRKK